MPNNYESCDECDSLNLSYRFIAKEDNQDIYEVVCRECGSSWQVYDYEINHV